MYIGEEDNRGIAICTPKQKHAPRHAMLKVKPLQTPTTKISISTPRIYATKDKKKSTNTALIIASVTAAVLVTCVTLASAVKYLLKNNRYITSLSVLRFTTKFRDYNSFRLKYFYYIFISLFKFMLFHKIAKFSL